MTMEATQAPITTFCTACGDRLPDDATFCPTCGSRVQPDATAIDVAAADARSLQLVRWATRSWQVTWGLVVLQGASEFIGVWMTNAWAFIAALAVAVVAVFATCVAVPFSLAVSIVALARVPKETSQERRQARTALIASMIALLPWIADIVLAIVIIGIWRNDIRLAP